LALFVPLGDFSEPCPVSQDAVSSRIETSMLEAYIPSVQNAHLKIEPYCNELCTNYIKLFLLCQYHVFINFYVE